MARLYSQDMPYKIYVLSFSKHPISICLESQGFALMLLATPVLPGPSWHPKPRALHAWEESHSMPLVHQVSRCSLHIQSPRGGRVIQPAKSHFPASWLDLSESSRCRSNCLLCPAGAAREELQQRGQHLPLPWKLASAKNLYPHLHGRDRVLNGRLD